MGDFNKKRIGNIQGDNTISNRHINYTCLGLVILVTLSGTIHVIRNQNMSNKKLVKPSAMAEHKVDLSKPWAEVCKGSFKYLSLLQYYGFINGFSKEDRVYNAADFDNGILYFNRLFKDSNEDISDIEIKRLLYTATADDLDLEYRQSLTGSEETNSDDIIETLEALFKRIDPNVNLRFENFGANKTDCKTLFELDGIRRRIANRGNNTFELIMKFLNLVSNNRENISDGALLMINIELNNVIESAKNKGFITDAQEAEVIRVINSLNLSETFIKSNKPYSKTHILKKIS